MLRNSYQSFFRCHLLFNSVSNNDLFLWFSVLKQENKKLFCFGLFGIFLFFFFFFKKNFHQLTFHLRFLPWNYYFIILQNTWKNYCAGFVYVKCLYNHIIDVQSIHHRCSCLFYFFILKAVVMCRLLNSRILGLTRQLKI